MWRKCSIEHYLLHCELYFNEREAMRTTLSQQTCITELTTDLLLGCDDSDLKERIWDGDYFGFG